jgi:hypothetical protein
MCFVVDSCRAQHCEGTNALLGARAPLFWPRMEYFESLIDGDITMSLKHSYNYMYVR